ncbi:unnamed protein product [Bursaphelenchus okinawaensis]|uniref:Glycosyl hydrolase family 13 catalytic domain-containing protein n=1 Tax=Bursaphelenchus okinawaensis TaxID=465554 RepID=A0A811KSQ2_9BILA|nr:unnamed protein product [Bursaphelenchus okinawaensis]CAG9112679.1 unnamed protein product [Bursaphelenchus okinawaensis]
MASEKLVIDPAVDNVVVDNGDTQVKFTKDGESIDLKPEQKLIGLTKEQLEKYRNDPFWKSARYFVFALFWIIWLVMFVGAILIVVTSAKCAPKKEQAWFQNTVAYQIFTPSFKDSDKDGVGDFNGIAEKLNSLRKIGISTIWPTPLLQTNKDEYDPAAIVNGNEIDTRFGTEEDLKNLIEEVHGMKMKFIADLPLTESRVQNLTNENKLIDLTSDSAIEGLKKIAVSLLNLGVDGIHLAQYGLSYNFDVTEKLEQLAGLIREEAKENFHDNNPENLLLFSDLPITRPQRNLNLYTRPLYRFPNATTSICQAQLFYDCFAESARTGAGQVDRNVSSLPLWQLGDVSRPRPVLRGVPRDKVPFAAAATTAIQLMLPGSSSIYFGEELGLPAGTDGKSQHGLMAWTDGKNGGFSDIDGKIFFQQLPDKDVKALNFETQYQASHSALRGFQKIAGLKNRDEVFVEGKLTVKRSDGLTVYTRSLEGNEKAYLLVVNIPQPGDSSTKLYPVSSKVVENFVTSHVELVWNQPKNPAIPSHVELNEKLTLNPYEYVLLRATVVKPDSA